MLKPNFVQAKLDYINEFLGTNYKALPPAERKFFEVLKALNPDPGGGGPISTDQLPEGLNNKYFTEQRVADMIDGYALLDSPVFVGEPQAPTVGPADTSNRLATTAFVKQAITAAGGGGGSGPTSTDELGEGVVNLYFTPTRAQEALEASLSDLNVELEGKAPLVHTHALEALTQSGAVDGQVAGWNGTSWVPVNQTGGGGGGPADTDDLPEGSANLYFTSVRAQGAMAATVAGLEGEIDSKAEGVHTHALSSITQSGATTGQAPIWNGTAWAPADVEGGGVGGTVISKSVPPGSIVYGYWGAAPEGYLDADGQAVSRTTYAVLFEAMGSPNTGDGSTTFTLPDLRGEFLRGLDLSRGVDSGRVLGSAQASQNLSHTHSVTVNSGGAHTHTGTAASAGTHTHTFSDSTSQPIADSYQVGISHPGFVNNFVSRTTDSSGSHSHSLSIDQAAAHTHTASAANEGGLEARPRNVALRACIKYTAATESSGSIPGLADTDELPEGTVNLYYTDLRAQTALSSDLAGKANTTHTHVLGDLLQTGATEGQVPQWNGTAWIAATVSGGSGPANTDALPEGTTNLYYTDARVANKAPLASPAFTGTPTAPTAFGGTDTTQVATTAFVTTAVAAKAARTVPYQKLTTTATATTLNFNTYEVIDLTLDRSVTFTAQGLTGIAAGRQLTFVLRIRQGASLYSMTWFAGITWITSGGTAPTAPAIGKIVEYIFTYEADNGWIGRVGAST